MAQGDLYVEFEPPIKIVTVEGGSTGKLVPAGAAGSLRAPVTPQPAHGRTGQPEEGTA